MKRRPSIYKRALFCLMAAAFLSVFFGLAASNAPSTEAVKATDFKAGRIIDDEIFYNPDTMTVEEIQAHLDRYSASCDMWGEHAIGYGRSINGVSVNPNITRRQYAQMMRNAGRTDYHDAPYVCISKYYENPNTHKTNFETNAVPEDGMISAAEIIYNAAHTYNINPQVLLVMLKKESYVWGDTWPLKNEYNTAMGYACPDNAPCDAKYFGFYNQVMKAAWQLDYYKKHIYSYGYYPYMTNNIYYSPTYSCGTKAVYLENIATTSLYIYTPYTPNDAALANYPGTAYCGSYGNRNFFMFFSEWFGSTYAPVSPIEEPNEEPSGNENTNPEGGNTETGNTDENIPEEGTTTDNEDGGNKNDGNQTNADGTASADNNGTEPSEPVNEGTNEPEEVNIQDLLKNNIKAVAEKTDLAFQYQTSVEKVGWMDWVKGGEMGGTTNSGLRLEALSIKLDEGKGLEYQAHVQNIGWQDWKKDGEVAGTTDQNLRLEAIKIKLSSELAEKYDIYYRAHVENIGWQDWKKDGEIAGTSGMGLRVEAIQIKIVSRISYHAHVENIGWQDWINTGSLAGTTGKGLRVEALEIKLAEAMSKNGDILYHAHVQNVGWQDWAKNGELAGTTGKGLRVEAIEIKLSDSLAKKYNILYRTHVQNVGWQDWAKNGELAGTTGKGLRVEAIEIKLVEK